MHTIIVKKKKKKKKKIIITSAKIMGNCGDLILIRLM